MKIRKNSLVDIIVKMIISYIKHNIIMVKWC